ncbi:MAG: acyl-CoA carboxylase subunit beta [Propionicimonas sp.]|uniref:acyl-CoA carboxylase subunit beta n=1 Tax=Propionicimonas sp. TaxID=1955623 RepID=UPI002B20E1FF|nr:acyl-CoA carboxylase subunit beta [Propionicimonas sp.]MEA4945091.1 acyl-CoA carboxylase subunit beta [Propionicimonas sp.]MEA5117103.1 acyl-CoA carboxylase subunit beta [Propionicimonas sp.]
MATKPVPMKKRVTELAEARAKDQQGGGEARLEKQRSSGKLTARERLDAFLDADSFQEVGLFRRNRTTTFGMDVADMPADGVVTGAGTVLGRPVHVASQDFTVMGGSAGETHNKKVVEMMHAALTNGTPFVFINDSGGARIQEGIDSLSGYGQVFYANVELSGVVPQISIIAGPCAGGAVYSPALTDFVIQTRKAHMFITGPNVIKQVTGEDVSQDALGGADTHMAVSGVNHFVADDDEQAILIAKKLLSFLPQNNAEEPPVVEGDPNVEYDPEFSSIVPVDGKQGYDVRDIIARLVDFSDFLEVQAGYAQNIVVGFGRINGRSVGIVANQPNVLAGVLDINASDKGAKFVRFCNAFNIPIVTLVDVPGYLPGVAQEHGGIIRHGAKMLYAYSSATVPLVTVVLRKAYGGSYLAMACRDLGADKVFAWPTAEIAVMGAEGAAAVVFRKEIAAADDPAARQEELVEEYRNTFATPFMAASRGLVDDIIDPGETRQKVAQALELLANKRKTRPAKKHGLMPV